MKLLLLANPPGPVGVGDTLTRAAEFQAICLTAQQAAGNGTIARRDGHVLVPQVLGAKFEYLELLPRRNRSRGGRLPCCTSRGSGTFFGSSVQRRRAIFPPKNEPDPGL
jgi:hypothetical protein